MTSTVPGRAPADPEGEGCVPSGLREQKKAEKRSRILSTAGRLFAERGYEGVTTAELAREAGVGVGTLFRYAGSKSELLVVILNERLRNGVEVGLRMAEQGATPVDALMAVFAPLIEECRGHTGNTMAYEREVLFGSGPERDRAVDQLSEMEATVVAILAHAPAKRAPVGAADLPRLAHAVVGAVYLDVVRACRDTERMAGLAGRVRDSLEFLLRGIDAPPMAQPVLHLSSGP